MTSPGSELTNWHRCLRTGMDSHEQASLAMPVWHTWLAMLEAAFATACNDFLSSAVSNAGGQTE